MDKILSHIETHAWDSGSTSLLIKARIDHRNEPSKKMFLSAGFEYDSRHEELEIWSYDRSVEQP